MPGPTITYQNGTIQFHSNNAFNRNIPDRKAFHDKVTKQALCHLHTWILSFWRNAKHIAGAQQPELT